MRFSQLLALVLVFGLTLSFDVSAKPSWKDTSSTTEKPGGKKNRDTTTDTTTTDPVVDTTTDTSTTDPVVDTTTDTSTTDPVLDTTTDTSTTDPVVDTTTDTSTTDPVVDTTTDTSTTDPVVDTSTTDPVADTTTGTATLTWDIPVSRENGEPLLTSELSGYKVVVRDTDNNTEYFVMITDPTITQWEFAELTSGTWEFSIASIDTQGVYSSYSSATSKTISDTTTTDPIADTTTDTTTTDSIADISTDTTTTDPIADTTTDTTTTDLVADTSTDTTTTEEPIADVTAEPAAPGSATLTWDIPVSRENGDYLAISELNGYKVLVRDTANNTEYFVMITDPTITQWDFAELTSGTWEFSIASIDTQGSYSSYSSVTSKNIN